MAISAEEQLAELEDSKNTEKIIEFSEDNNISFDFCQRLLTTYKFSLSKLGKILSVLKNDLKYPQISNLPFMAKKVFGQEYSAGPYNDKYLIKGYLQSFYNNGNQRCYLNNFDDRLLFFNRKSDKKFDNTEIINMYMQFIYSTLEYYIMPIVNIGIELKEENLNWHFGKNVLETIEICKKNYYLKTYGKLDVDSLTEAHNRIIGAMKDYGMIGIIKNLNEDILNEIEDRLNTRYSTIDVIRVIKKLANVNGNSHYREFNNDVKRRYMI